MRLKSADIAGRWDRPHKCIWWTICWWKLQVEAHWARNTVHGKYSPMLACIVSGEWINSF